MTTPTTEDMADAIAYGMAANELPPRMADEDAFRRAQQTARTMLRARGADLPETSITMGAVTVCLRGNPGDIEIDLDAIRRLGTIRGECLIAAAALLYEAGLLLRDQERAKHEAFKNSLNRKAVPPFAGIARQAAQGLNPVF